MLRKFLSSLLFLYGILFAAFLWVFHSNIPKDATELGRNSHFILGPICAVLFVLGVFVWRGQKIATGLSAVFLLLVGGLFCYQAMAIGLNDSVNVVFFFIGAFNIFMSIITVRRLVLPKSP